MKVESQVIVDQHATVNLYLDFVHTARHMQGVSSVWSYLFLFIQQDKNFLLVFLLRLFFDNWPLWNS